MIDYDPHIWRDHLFDFRGSVLRMILPRIAVVAGWAAIITVVDRLFFPIEFPSTAHALVGVALGLLLVFRTNASYDRFWEGRRQWGSLINASRNLARGSVAIMSASSESSKQVRLWTAAFAYALMHRLRDQPGFGEFSKKLPEISVGRCVDSGNTPLAAAIQISSAITTARNASEITDHQQHLLDTQVANLVDVAGACDRIHRTPLPFAYVVHLRRALVIYCITLPPAILEGFGWWTILVSVSVAFILLGIEEIGVEIEDPFGFDDNDLPLEQFCTTIERDLEGVAKEFDTSALKLNHEHA